MQQVAESKEEGWLGRGGEYWGAGPASSSQELLQGLRVSQRGRARTCLLGGGEWREPSVQSGMPTPQLGCWGPSADRCMHFLAESSIFPLPLHITVTLELLLGFGPRLGTCNSTNCWLQPEGK